MSNKLKLAELEPTTPQADCELDNEELDFDGELNFDEEIKKNPYFVAVVWATLMSFVKYPFKVVGNIKRKMSPSKRKQNAFFRTLENNFENDIKKREEREEKEERERKKAEELEQKENELMIQNRFEIERLLKIICYAVLHIDSIQEIIKNLPEREIELCQTQSLRLTVDSSGTISFFSKNSPTEFAPQLGAFSLRDDIIVRHYDKNYPCEGIHVAILELVNEGLTSEILIENFSQARFDDDFFE